MKRGTRKRKSDKRRPSTKNRTSAKRKEVAKPRRGAAKKSNAKKRYTPKTVDQYLASVPEASRAMVSEMRAAIRSIVPPDATEAISYGIPAIKYKGTLVWYAAFANHCSLFPTAAVIEEFKSELKDFSTSKGTIQFPLGQPLPVELINKIVEARLAQVEGKKA